MTVVCLQGGNEFAPGAAMGRLPDDTDLLGLPECSGVAGSSWGTSVDL